MEHQLTREHNSILSVSNNSLGEQVVVEGLRHLSLNPKDTQDAASNLFSVREFQGFPTSTAGGQNGQNARSRVLLMFPYMKFHQCDVCLKWENPTRGTHQRSVAYPSTLVSPHPQHTGRYLMSEKFLSMALNNNQKKKKINK